METSAAQVDGTNTRALGLLKIGVVVMGVVFVAGFVLVAGTIVYRAMHAGEKVAVQRSFGVSDIHIDVGSSVKDMVMSDERLAAHVVGPKGEAIILINPKTGQEYGRIRLQPLSDFAAAQP